MGLDSCVTGFHFPPLFSLRLILPPFQSTEFKVFVPYRRASIRLVRYVTTPCSTLPSLPFPRFLSPPPLQSVSSILQFLASVVLGVNFRLTSLLLEWVFFFFVFPFRFFLGHVEDVDSQLEPSRPSLTLFLLS